MMIKLKKDVPSKTSINKNLKTGHSSALTDERKVQMIDVEEMVNLEIVTSMYCIMASTFTVRMNLYASGTYMYMYRVTKKLHPLLFLTLLHTHSK